jgi:hypothetical protein
MKSDLQIEIEKEMERVETVAGHYREIPTGVFALKGFIEPAIEQGRKALESLDAVDMVRALAMLRDVGDD